MRQKRSRQRRERREVPRPDLPSEAPPFFVPHAVDREQSESVWQSVREFMRMQGFATSERRVYSIGFTKDGVDYVETVNSTSRYFHEPVFVILEATGPSVVGFLLCSPNRGVLRGEPAMVGGQNVWDVRDFADS